jgi:hypothetical protein
LPPADIQEGNETKHDRECRRKHGEQLFEVEQWRGGWIALSFESEKKCAQGRYFFAQPRRQSALCFKRLRFVFCQTLVHGIFDERILLVFQFLPCSIAGEEARVQLRRLLFRQLAEEILAQLLVIRVRFIS